MTIKELIDLLQKRADNEATVRCDGIDVVGIDVCTRYNDDGAFGFVQLLLDDNDGDCE